MLSNEFNANGFVPGTNNPRTNGSRTNGRGGFGRGGSTKSIPTGHGGGTAPRHVLPVLCSVPGQSAVVCRECHVYFQCHLNSNSLLCHHCLTSYINDFYAPAEKLCQKCSKHTTKAGRFLCDSCFDVEIAAMAKGSLTMEDGEVPRCKVCNKEPAANGSWICNKCINEHDSVLG